MIADIEKVRVWKVMIVDCFSVQSSIRQDLMSKAMFNARIGPVRILVVFHLKANPNVAIGQTAPLNVFLK
jgi:hypothetical protein